MFNIIKYINYKLFIITSYLNLQVYIEKLVLFGFIYEIIFKKLYFMHKIE